MIPNFIDFVSKKFTLVLSSPNNIKYWILCVKDTCRYTYSSWTIYRYSKKCHWIDLHNLFFFIDYNCYSLKKIILVLLSSFLGCSKGSFKRSRTNFGRNRESRKKCFANIEQFIGKSWDAFRRRSFLNFKLKIRQTVKG